MSSSALIELSFLSGNIRDWWLKAVSSSSSSSTSANVDHNRAPPPVPEKSAGYRSLIDSGGYKSILPDEPPFTVASLSNFAVTRSLIDSGGYKSILPDEPPFTVASLSNFAVTRENAGYTVTVVTHKFTKVISFRSPVTFNTSRSNVFDVCGKPTVQVHPMPSSLPHSVSSSSIPSMHPASCTTTNNNNPDIVPEKVREKPAVPKKPAKLILSSASVEAASLTPLNLSTSSLNLFSPSAQSSPSTSSSFRLFSSPSFVCLHSALMEPSLTDEEIERLDAKRKQVRLDLWF
ncbi:unnamed protein product [Gongylonema pulchrum]|uniref:MSP domain-containing protein n=1 Tax=Gongylonema pulchrum TaxID=637853 RepID=A0A183E3U9_9BILA|nr:unnamed protein product [Gongylonema pulchrum]